MKPRNGMIRTSIPSPRNPSPCAIINLLARRSLSKPLPTMYCGINIVNFILRYKDKRESKLEQSRAGGAHEHPSNPYSQYLRQKLILLIDSEDESCFEKELEKRVFEKERFKGKTLDNLQSVIMEGIKDTTPITQVRVGDNVLNLDDL